MSDTTASKSGAPPPYLGWRFSSVRGVSSGWSRGWSAGVISPISREETPALASDTVSSSSDHLTDAVVEYGVENGPTELGAARDAGAEAACAPRDEEPAREEGAAWEAGGAVRDGGVARAEGGGAVRGFGGGAMF
jgi:hypothetical protein